MNSINPATQHLSSIAPKKYGARWFSLMVLLGIMLSPVHSAHALSLNLPGLVQGASEPQPGTVNLNQFRGLLQQLTDLMVPLYTDGGNTSGDLGYEAGFGWGIGFITDESTGWENGTRDSSKAVNVMGFGVRKGLPWATELGVYMSNIGNSPIWAFGMELEASPVAGLANIPDISIASGVGSATGTGDMNMLMVSSRVTVSKSFAPSATIALVPFAGFQTIFVRGYISVLTTSKIDGATSAQWSEQLPPPTLGWVNRGVGGVRALLGPVSVTLVGGMSESTQRVTFEVGIRY